MERSATGSLSDRERLDRLRLARSENVGPVTFRQLLARYGSAEQAIAALPDLAARGGRRRPLSVCPTDAAERECENLGRHGGRHVFFGEAAYPVPLAAIEDAPIALSVIGDTSLLQRDGVAVVGARNASTNGRNFARRLAADLAADKLIVVSGMARGIDAAAHEGALEDDGDTTVAVLAGGVDVVYPRENAALYDALHTRGLVLSEMPCGMQPQARHFPRRNRIISGLSLGVVVVEAAMRSGSLITARLAGEQGREVFAVPGSPLDPRCRGANDLIRKGAKLTESAEDVLSELSAMRQGPAGPALRRHPGAPAEPAPAPSIHESNGLADRIAELLGPTPVPVDDIIRDTGSTAGAVWSALLDLELAGRIERQPGNLVARLAR